MKKFAALLLSLMLLVMPMAGLAETTDETTYASELEAVMAALAQEEDVVDYTTKAIEAGRRITTTISVGDVADSFVGEETVDQVIADLLEAINLTYYVQNDEEYFSIGMKQAATGEIANLLDFGFAYDDGKAYIASNLLGNTITVSADEVEPLLNRLLDMCAMAGLLEEDDVKSMKSELSAMIEMVKAEAEGIMQSAANANIDFAALDYSAIIDAVAPILSRIQTNAVTMQPKNSDPAVAEMSVEVTGDELEALIISFFRFIQANPDMMAAFETGYNSAAAGVQVPTAEESLNQMIEQMGQEMQIDGNAKLQIFVDEAGMPVSAVITLNVEGAQPAITYTRLTMNDSVAHSVVAVIDTVDITVNVIDKSPAVTVNLAVAEEGVTLFSASVEALDRSAENLIAFDMLFVMDIVEPQYDYQYNAISESYEVVELEPVTTQICAKLVTDTVLNGVDFTDNNALTIGVNGKDYLTINIDSVTSEPGASIKDGTVVQPAAMSDADFANWFVGVYNGLLNWVYSVIPALPASVMNLMMN